jgi:hypothetical protein
LVCCSDVLYGALGVRARGADLNCVADVCALRGHADDAPIVNSGEFAPVLEEVRGEATRKYGVQNALLIGRKINS